MYFSVSKLVRLQQGSVYVHGLIDLINGVLIPNLNNLLAMKKQNELNLSQLDAEIEKFRASSSTINAEGLVSASGKNLERGLSIPPSTIDVLNDFIDGSTFDLDLLTESGPLSHPLESTDLDHEETNAANERLKELKQTEKLKSTKQEDFGFVQGPPKREHQIQLRIKPGPSNYQETKKNRKQVAEVEPSPSLQNSAALPTAQFIPFSMYRTPGEAQYPDTSSLTNAAPLSDSAVLDTRQHPPRKSLNENRVAHSAGTRREKPMRTEAPLDPELLMPINRGTSKEVLLLMFLKKVLSGDGQVEGVRIPRMSDSLGIGSSHLNDASRN